MTAFHKKIADILTDLQNPDFGIRRLAIRDLIVSDYPHAIETLQNLLTVENDIQLRYEIRKGLNELQTVKKSSPPSSVTTQSFKNLSRAFESNNREILKKAFIYAVKNNLDDFLPIMLMVEAYTNDSFFKICNIRLFLSSTQRNFKYIWPYLQDRDPRVVSAAIEALGQVGNSSALASVTELTSHESEQVSTAAVKALQSLGKDKAYALFVKMIQSPHAAYRDSAAYALAVLGLHEGVQLLSLLLLDEEESVRARALAGLELLAAQGGAKASTILERLKNDPPHGLWPNKLYEKLSEDAEAGGTSAKFASVAALYADVPDSSVTAVDQIIAELSEASAVGIMERLKKETDPKILQAVLLALGRSDGQREQKAIVLRCYLSHRQPEVRSGAIRAMAMFLSGHEMAAIVTCLRDNDCTVVGNAIIALYHNPMYKEACFRALKKLVMEDEKSQKVAALCISEIFCDELVAEAEVLLHSEHEDVRSSMEEILALMPENSALFLLWKEYRQGKDDFTIT